jgi:hypothetical protein
MEEEFQEQTFKEISYRSLSGSGNMIKAKDAKIVGTAKISVEEESHDGVKIVLKKDADENIKEIKFVCSCGETKSVLLDYSAE